MCPSAISYVRTRSWWLVSPRALFLSLTVLLRLVSNSWARMILPFALLHAGTTGAAMVPCSVVFLSPFMLLGPDCFVVCLQNYDSRHTLRLSCPSICYLFPPQLERPRWNDSNSICHVYWLYDLFIGNIFQVSCWGRRLSDSVTDCNLF